ncbi:MAG: site-2 protease family protein [Synergistaceae bacterium]|jgi:Zn-dependent protease|nr:site-2 protease family protein [Synergistaceae bacterium]
MRFLNNPAALLLTAPAVLWAITFHEFCHGYVAKLVGDPTAEREGRLTLNPMAHFDLVGTLLLLFAGFGWAKPVPINTRYFRHPRRDIVLVSLAGVAGNLLTAFVCVLFFRFFGGPWLDLTGMAGFQVVWRMIIVNMGLAAFNLIPIPPLDGSKILYAFIPFHLTKYYYWLEQYGTIILIMLVVTGAIDILFNPIARVLWALLPLGRTMW